MFLWKRNAKIKDDLPPAKILAVRGSKTLSKSSATLYFIFYATVNNMQFEFEFS